MNSIQITLLATLWVALGIASYGVMTGNLNYLGTQILGTGMDDSGGHWSVDPSALKVFRWMSKLFLPALGLFSVLLVLVFVNENKSNWFRWSRFSLLHKGYDLTLKS